MTTESNKILKYIENQCLRYIHIEIAGKLHVLDYWIEIYNKKKTKSAR